MSKKDRIILALNDKVLNGGLPLAFFNSTILKAHEKEESISKVYKRYMQSDIPDATLNLLISKIYNVF